MAEEQDFESKTEAPSPRRREEAHEQGQFAYSPELTSGISLFFGVGALAILAHTLGGGLLAQMRADLAVPPPQELALETVQHLLDGAFARALTLVGVLLGGLFLAALAANVAQVGFHLNPTKFAPDWDRVSFLKFERLLSWSKIVRGLILLLKMIAVAAVAWWILRQRGGEIAQVGNANLGSAVAQSWTLVLRLALGLAGTLLLIGIIDFAFQRWQFERSLCMTKQELKDELKREEGDPQIKARIRKMQRDTAQRKMFKKIPQATVIVTNPTHLAVAIQYDAVTMVAPKVVAKGAGHVALRIVRLARRYGVPIMERKPLAQALYKTVKIDKEIPLAMYLVVAELLSHVYRLQGGAPSQATLTAKASARV